MKKWSANFRIWHWANAVVVSRLIINFYQELGLSKEMAHDIKELREAVYNIILVFVPLHVVGVVVADIRDEKGIISNMVNGRKTRE